MSVAALASVPARPFARLWFGVPLPPCSAASVARARRRFRPSGTARHQRCAPDRVERAAGQRRMRMRRNRLLAVCGSVRPLAQPASSRLPDWCRRERCYVGRAASLIRPPPRPALPRGRPTALGKIALRRTGPSSYPRPTKTPRRRFKIRSATNPPVPVRASSCCRLLVWRPANRVWARSSPPAQKITHRQPPAELTAVRVAGSETVRAAARRQVAFVLQAVRRAEALGGSQLSSAAASGFLRT